MRLSLLTAAIIAMASLNPATASADTSVPADASENSALPAMRAHTHSSVVTKDRHGNPVQKPTDFSAVVGFGRIHEVFIWSPQFIFNADLNTPVVSSGQWIAAAVRADQGEVGTATVWRPPGKTAAEVGSFDGDVALAKGLRRVPSSARLVNDPTIGAWYYLKDGEVTPVAFGIGEPSGTMTLEAFQNAIARRYEGAVAGSIGMEGAAGGAGATLDRHWYGHSGVLPTVGGLAALAGAGLVRRTLKRRSERV